MDDELRFELRASFLLNPSRTHAVIKNVTDDIPRVNVWRFRYWPRWLCWLFGHEPVEYGDDVGRDNMRCLCGTYEPTGVVYTLMHRGRHRRWARLIRSSWRALP